MSEKRRSVIARVFGIVQGVGFRPTVKRHADRFHIAGTVCNKGSYVEIVAHGESEAVVQFLEAVEKEPPERAVILNLDVEELALGCTAERTSAAVLSECFAIVESAHEEGAIFVSPDIAICPACKEELYDPGNRRYLHPFINCTCCGPRLTILDAMPYDRERTSMAAFPMCEACAEEYFSPATRRFDAQPVCCNSCGPEVYLLDGSARGAAAIRRVREVIRDGGIAAIKGIGGFHLCCDATSEAAVRKLRARKRRPMKPFAVMMRDMDTVRGECEVAPFLEEILDGHQKPIVLLPRRSASRLAEAVAPDNPKVGVLLPYAPIHLLLFDSKDDLHLPDCLVMTSANTSGAPICRDDADARAELSSLADVILSHDRLIRLRADDSVMDVYRDAPYMIRRSRGYAPLPFFVRQPFQGAVLAVGGELKNTFCIGKDQLFYPSPYIGDMGDVRTVRALKESVARMEELLETKPQIVACDLHPAYNTRTVAEEYGLPVFYVQHHYAHILSCMAENDCAEPVIGVSFDGTGYGTDGTIWGGEVLLADYAHFTRWGAIEPFYQMGGDLSAKEGWRIAVSLLGQIYGTERASEYIDKLGLCDPAQARLLFAMQERGVNTVRSTSAGRLFDGVSALLGIRTSSTFEGEASTALQFAAERAKNSERAEESESLYEKRNRGDFTKECYTLPTLALVRELVERRLAGESAERLARDFHIGLAGQIAAACERAGRETGRRTVALSGGVFQNTLLLGYSVRFLEEKGFHVLTHHLIPPNDGGICLGQAVAAMRHLYDTRVKRSCVSCLHEKAGLLDPCITKKKGEKEVCVWDCRER